MHKTDNTRVPCDMCNKTFASHTTLKSHQKYAHSKERNEQCTYCDEKFKQKRDLRLHLASIHDVDQSREKYGEPCEKEVFKCGNCESTFGYKKNLNAHIRTKHKASVERFKCEECQSDFRDKRTLVDHV
jgi:KRAB domain-containing zinc finger protein